MRRRTKSVIIGLCVLSFVIPLLLWGGALIKNRILTANHKTKIENMQSSEHEEPLPELDWYRITACSDEKMEIYFVNTLGKDTDREYKIGGKLICTKTSNGWHHTSLEEGILWSGAGSADDYIWPYWHHIFLACEK